MKLFAFSCFVTLLVQIVAESKPANAMLSPTNVRSQSMMTSISGGALTRRHVAPVGQDQPFGNAVNAHSKRAALTQRKVAFLPEQEANTAPAKKHQETRPSLWGKVKATFGSKDGLSLKDRLAKKGFAAFLTFTFLSNITSMSCLSFAWYAFSVQTGMSPLFPGQWKPFLAVLAGSMAVDASTKPIRLAVSLAAAPMSDKAMSWLQQKCGSKRVAYGVVFAAIIGSAFGLLGAGVCLASSVSGVPIFAP